MPNPRPHICHLDLPARSGEPVPGARSKQPAACERTAALCRPQWTMLWLAAMLSLGARPLLGAPAPRCAGGFTQKSPLAAAALAMRSESRPAERQCMPAQATMQVLVSPDRIAYHILDKERSRRSSNGSSCLVTRLQRICVSALRLIDCA